MMHTAHSPGRAIGRPARVVALVLAACLGTSTAGATVPPAEDTGAHRVRALHAALSRCRTDLPDHLRWRIAGTVHRESSRYGFDPLLVQAVIEVESRCAPAARSPVGALGLMQLRPATGRAMAERLGLPWRGSGSLVQPTVNVRLGLHYLHILEERFGDPLVALAAYNLGPTRVSRLPARQARRARYVRRVMRRYERLVRDLPDLLRPIPPAQAGVAVEPEEQA